MKTEPHTSKSHLSVDEDDARIQIDEACGICTLNFKYPYEIDLDRIKTERDLLAWTLHLAGKTWMDRGKLVAFIEAIGKHKKLKIFGL